MWTARCSGRCAAVTGSRNCLCSGPLPGETRPESDIDIMVEFQAGVRVGLIKYESLVEELAALAGRRVDLVTKRGLKPWVRPEVLRDARVIYAA